MKIYTANWVLPIVSEPIEQGAVVVDGAHIEKIGTRAEVFAAFPDINVEDFGEAAILPGFINCHSHLELTAMRGFLASEEGHFHAWLKKLTAARQNRMNEEDLYVSAACGVVEALRSGITCLGDSSSVGATAMRAMHDVGVRGIVYHEAFGIDPNVAVSQFEKLKDSLGQLKERETDLVRVGVSPHAPYTVSARLLELIAEYSIAERMPLMIHAAE
jgi:aminodeoxyfutalosine deaminase